MTISASIKSIFESPKFRSDLGALSSYAANIRQERPIVVLFAKYFWQQGERVALEKNKCDLVVNGTRIEFKVHFDSDIPMLQRELNKYDGNLETLMKAVSAKEHSRTWNICPGIYKDVIMKRPDIFVWILQSRELSKLTDDEIARVCVGNDQRNFNRNNPYESSKEFLDVADGFLEKLKEYRQFSVEQTTLRIDCWFPSTYHLRICEFLDDQKSLD